MDRDRLPSAPVHRLLALAAIIALAASLAGCGVASVSQGPRGFAVSSVAQDGSAWTVNVTDETALVTAVDVDPAGVTAPAGGPVVGSRPDQVLIGWVGGACDTNTSIRLTPQGGRIIAAFSATQAAGACDAVGVVHVLQLTFSKPIPAGMITVQGG